MANRDDIDLATLLNETNSLNLGKIEIRLKSLLRSFQLNNNDFEVLNDQLGGPELKESDSEDGRAANYISMLDKLDHTSNELIVAMNYYTNQLERLSEKTGIGLVSQSPQTTKQ